VTSKSQDDIQRVSEVRATVSRKGSFFFFLVHVCCICWHTGRRKVEFICCAFGLFLGYVYTPGLWRWKTRMEKRGANCLHTFRFVLSFLLFSFSLSFSVYTIHQAIHTLHPDPARSRPAPLLYRDGGQDVVSCAYRYSWFGSLSVQRPILLQLTHILYTSCVVPTSSLRSTR
jgi:hypothetical protein